MFRARGQAPEKADVDSFEAVIDCALPEDYRAFLLEGDGAVFSQPNFLDRMYRGSLFEVFCLTDLGVTRRSLWDALDLYRNKVPKGFLAVGDDREGNLVCLGIRGEHRDKVYLWDYENAARGDEEVGMANMEHVADSFARFLDRVKT